MCSATCSSCRRLVSEGRGWVRDATFSSLTPDADPLPSLYLLHSTGFDIPEIFGSLLSFGALFQVSRLAHPTPGSFHGLTHNTATLFALTAAGHSDERQGGL